MRSRPVHRSTVSAVATVVLLLSSATGGAPAAAAACGVPPAPATLPVASPPQAGGLPALPAVYLDTTFVRPTGRSIKVEPDDRAGTTGGLQTALDAALPGDVIELRAGGVYTGNFVLPEKAGAGWITIRSWSPPSNFPPQGTRIRPNLSGSLPRIVTANAAPAIATAAGAHHYRFVGIEFAVADGVPTNGGIVVFGDPNQTSLADVPTDLVVDRCIVRGNATGDITRGVTLNSARTAVVDSHVSEIHSRFIDTQAVCGWAGPGPFKVVNNYLEGAAENIMFGGGDPKIADLVPSDIEIRRNHLFKPMRWRQGDPSYAGIPWVVKNLLELKNARRVLVEGNLLENNWVAAQSGYAVLFTVRNQDGTAPWSVVEDVTFENNTVRRSSSGVNILLADDIHTSEQGRRVLLRNNMFDELGAPSVGGQGNFLLIASGVDVTIDHNTIIHTGAIITAYGGLSPGFAYTNNCASHNEYGVIGDGVGIGKTALDAFFPEQLFKRNVLAGGVETSYPEDNLFPATLASVGLTPNSNGKYKLDSESPLVGAGSDGADIGCDLRTVWGKEGTARDGVPEAGTASLRLASRDGGLG
jgi:hypothetical protein